ncbi:unnamed protein product [Acanthoscelides obtectus]|uniref:Uncharacterized protein n=1 Tax=Acanthoscelides obtectus TaxID=200917 RepID=A0A9P0K014_ACAOB|nr:unnamed protein product [Acanthoscelides obtectus]CAK1660328.1 hypothetical protein AOBTE_LOCUS21997 [Acanthoscelides obtectus]
MDVSEARPSGVKLITRKKIYDIMKGYTKNDINKKMDYAESFLLNFQNFSEEQRKEDIHKLSNLKSEIKRRWIAAHYIEELFLKRNNCWLQMIFEIP